MKVLLEFLGGNLVIDTDSDNEMDLWEWENITGGDELYALQLLEQMELGEEVYLNEGDKPEFIQRLSKHYPPADVAWNPLIGEMEI